MTLRLYVAQRLTAALMVPMLLLHLAMIFYATRNGLTAADILGRTRGSIAGALFYGAFVAAASVHAAIGVRTVLLEWTTLERRAAAATAIFLFTLLVVLGLRAVAAVVVA
jgi:fumarate reductase subunit C